MYLVYIISNNNTKLFLLFFFEKFNMEQIKKRFFNEAISRYVQLLIHTVIVLITIQRRCILYYTLHMSKPLLFVVVCSSSTTLTI